MFLPKDNLYRFFHVSNQEETLDFAPSDKTLALPSKTSAYGPELNKYWENLRNSGKTAANTTNTDIILLKLSKTCVQTTFFQLIKQQGGIFGIKIKTVIFC